MEADALEERSELMGKESEVGVRESLLSVISALSESAVSVIFTVCLSPGTSAASYLHDC